ncbi:hypothetical protein [Halorubellus sp. PRR65]|uniref:hypothetical protein n=1 Tax=Halorubellus sp. PRR65 TaxID=3098148 RepID=UPI002B25EF8F|nr:hypothetical protein [Halorubellus sp. PRR65]
MPGRIDSTDQSTTPDPTDTPPEQSTAPGDGARRIAADGRGEDDPEAPDLTRFERVFLGRPVARDLVLFGFLAGFYGGAMWLVTPVPATWGVGMGVAFAVGWLALMECYAWRRGTSMMRSVGSDPYADLLDGPD